MNLTCIASPWVSQPILPVILTASHTRTLVLHPRHKLTYFQNVKWLDRWIKKAEALVCEEFECFYASSDDGSDSESNEVSPVKQVKSCNIFDQLEALAPPKLSEYWSELDRYLNTDIEHVTDALVWWYEWRATFPRLSRMALDYLSIRGMCT